MDRKSKFMHRQEADNDDTWLVSYADMVTLLLGFFIILFSFSTLDPQKLEQVGDNLSEALGKADRPAQQRVKAAAIESKQKKRVKALSIMVSMMGPGASVDKLVEGLENAEEKGQRAAVVKDLMDKEILPYEDDLVDIIIPSRFLFKPGSISIDPAQEVQLTPIANKILKLEKLVDVTIEGHTDSSPVSQSNNFLNNWVLSSARAANIANSLIKYGVNPKVIKPYGMADSDPLYPERDARGRLIPGNRAKNRRVHIKMRVR